MKHVQIEDSLHGHLMKGILAHAQKKQAIFSPFVYYFSGKNLLILPHSSKKLSPFLQGLGIICCSMHIALTSRVHSPLGLS